MAKKEEERQSLEVSSHDPLKSVQSEIRGIEELSAALQCREKKAFASLQRASLLQRKLNVICLYYGHMKRCCRLLNKESLLMLSFYPMMSFF